MKFCFKLLVILFLSSFAYEANAQIIVKRKVVRKTTRISNASLQPKYSAYSYTVKKKGESTIIKVEHKANNIDISQRTPEQQKIADEIDAPIKPFAKLKKLGLKDKFKSVKGKLKKDEAKF